jgi:hypothetical protein
MSRVSWDDVLDEIEQTLDTVEGALADGDPVPPLAPFEPPTDVMPRLVGERRRRAQALMWRQEELTARISSEIVTTHVDMGDVRRRRRAAHAYARSG